MTQFKRRQRPGFRNPERRRDSFRPGRECPADPEGRGCLGAEACFNRKIKDDCPFQCDGCGDVSETVDDTGLCVECRHED